MVTRLADGVWWFDFPGVNAYLIEDSAGTTLVDTGMAWQSRRLRRNLTSVLGSVGDVDRVLLTHFDFDHVGGLDSLGELDAPVYVGADDEPYLSGRAKPDWQSRKGAFQRVADLFRDPPSMPVEPVADGETVGNVRAYHTPGHTPGHTCFVHEDLSVAVLGDMVREREGHFEVPPWFLNADDRQARESVGAFLDRSPSFEIACPGHGRPFVSDGVDRVRACVETLALDRDP